MDFIANTVVMVEPKHFAFNSQTASNNVFQHDVGETDLVAKATKEFKQMVSQIRAVGIDVIVLTSPKEKTPDAIFPNNWFSTHLIDDEPYLFIYPMFSANRQAEVQVALLEKALLEHTNKQYKVIDFRENSNNTALEGTGVFVFDHAKKYAFLSLSERADITLAERVVTKLGYKLVAFTSVDQKNRAIYHTNVMMSIGDKLAFVCLEAIYSEQERAMVKSTLNKLDKVIIELNYKQMYQMAANVLELRNNQNQHFLLLSKCADNALEESQKEVIDKYCVRVPCDIPTIETVGGGSVRCMLAEIFY
ncbi:arginine deiminase-related protein [Thiotrichales bacterium 19X7-9]|nr:arginine deiminase-related protein [Thiotrichales bacterium 19X7-9]MCF6774973.1 arginine deiminase-related protein [Thiotrichales bacterium 19X7-9]